MCCLELTKFCGMVLDDLVILDLLHALVLLFCNYMALIDNLLCDDLMRYYDVRSYRCFKVPKHLCVSAVVFSLMCDITEVIFSAARTSFIHHKWFYNSMFSTR